MLAVALEHHDAKRRFLAEIIHRREHAPDQTRIIGVVDLRAVQRDGGDPALVEVPQDRNGGHGRWLSLTTRNAGLAVARGSTGTTRLLIMFAASRTPLLPLAGRGLHPSASPSCVFSAA